VIREQDLLRQQAGAEEGVPPADATPVPDTEKEEAKPGTTESGKDEGDPQLEKAVELLKSWRIFKSAVPNGTAESPAKMDHKNAKNDQ
jgi:hypothetical protein